MCSIVAPFIGYTIVSYHVDFYYQFSYWDSNVIDYMNKSTSSNQVREQQIAQSHFAIHRTT